MSETDEITTPIVEQKRLLRQAEQDLVNRRLVASDEFKRSLLVASNAIQASRMLQNLGILVERKQAEQEADALALEEDLDEARAAFRLAIRDYNEQGILNAEGRIEQLTLSYDPLYLEGEEIRKRDYFEDQQKKQRVPKVKWKSNPSSRFVSLLKGDLEGVKEVTEEEQRSCISKCAWGFAIIGMIVAICFLIADFWSAQANPALSTNLSRNEELMLPVIYGCITKPLIPTFENLPNDEYKGAALWGLRSYTNVDTKDTLLYPKTKLIVEESFLGDRKYCSEALQYLSKEAIENALDSNFDPARKCYSCLKIGAKTPIQLRRKDAISRPNGAVTLEFATSRDLQFCFNPDYARSFIRKKVIKDTLLAHGPELVARGIVKIIDSTSVTPTIEFALKYGFEDFDDKFPNDSIPRLRAEASVFCNLYLFSGYFFPVKPGTETRYSYDINGDIESWKQLGNKSNFLSVSPPTDAPINRSTILAAIKGEEDAKDYTLSGMSVNIYSVNKPGDHPNAFKNFAASLRENHRDVLLFTKEIDGGESRYTSSMQLGARKLFKANGRFTRYNISLDFATFETETITRRPTTSTAEFLTDIFEYAGLFTGVCAYSVLVGPARLYLRRSNKPNQ